MNEELRTKLEELIALLNKDGYIYFISVAKKDNGYHGNGVIKGTLEDVYALIYQIVEDVDSDMAAVPLFGAAIEVAKKKNPRLLKDMREFLYKDTFFAKLKSLFS